MPRKIARTKIFQKSDENTFLFHISSCWCCREVFPIRGTISLLPNLCVRELSSYHHISKKIVWKYYYATISIWSPTNSGVKISVSLKGFRFCNNMCTPFWGFGSYRPVCLKKAKNLEVFYLSQFWNLNFEISKVSFH